MASDNIPGVSRRGWKAVFLAPGMVIQWLNYMLVGNLNYGKLRQQTRLARSPFMTWVYSIGFYFLFLFLLILVGAPFCAGEMDQKRSASTASSASLQRKCVELILEKGTMNRASATAYCVKYYENN